MSKLVNRVWFLLLLAAFVWTGTLIADREMLSREVIRFHVVAASDSPEDQAVKLQVRDAVLAYISEAAQELEPAQTQIWIRENLCELRTVANKALMTAGRNERAEVRFEQEEFDARKGEAVCLPAGVYHALRIRIGAAEGENWWGVLFPDLLATDGAVPAGGVFPRDLAMLLTDGDGYEIRFYLLDALGHLEKFLRGG